MTVESEDTIQPVSASDQFFNLLRAVIPEEFHELIGDKRAELIEEFFTSSPSERHNYLDLLRGRQEMLREFFLHFSDRFRRRSAYVMFIFDGLKQLLSPESSESPKAMSCPEYPPPATVTGINFEAAFSDSYVHQGDDASDLLPKPDGVAGINFQNHQAGASNGTPPGHDGAAYPNNGAAGTKFQNHQAGASKGMRTEFGAASYSIDQLSDDLFLHSQNLFIGASGTQFRRRLLEASDGTPFGHDAAYPNNGASGTKFQDHQAGASHGIPSDHDTPGHNSNTACTPNPSGSNNNLVLSVDGLLSGLQPPLPETLNKPVTNVLKEIHDFFQGNPELARDHPTWFRTLLGINGGVIITLITKSTGDNPQSVSNEIMESFTAFCGVVGFFVSLAGLYFSTNNPKEKPLGCDLEVSTRYMRILGGLATAFAFTSGVLLLLPNNTFRWITMGLAFAAFIIPILFKLLTFIFRT